MQEPILEQEEEVMAKCDNKTCITLLNIIRRKGEIHLFDLIEESNISLARYQQIKSLFLWKFDAHVKYDKKNKMWSKIYIEIEKEADEMIQEVLNDK